MSGLKFSYFKIIGIIERGGKCVLVVKSQKRNLKNTSPNNEKHFMNDRNSRLNLQNEILFLCLILLNTLLSLLRSIDFKNSFCTKQDKYMYISQTRVKIGRCNT